MALFPGRSWRQELGEGTKSRGISSNLSAADLAAYSSTRASAGSDSPQRLGRRFKSTERTMQDLDATCEKIAAVREMIRACPPPFPPPPPPSIPPRPAVDYTDHDEWLHYYANAPRYVHEDHGPWIDSPKSPP